MKKTSQRLLPQAALVLSAILLVLAYSPIFKVMLDPHMQFFYGDFQTKVGPDSAQLRKEAAFYTYTNGEDNLQSNNRLFTLGMFSALSDVFPFSDSQFHAGLILGAMVLGCVGLYFLVLKFEKRPAYQAALILIFCLFYFLNFWAVDRLGHTYIWLTYAVFPLFMFLGLEFISGSNPFHLVLYSLLLGFFGFLPHSLMYLMMIHGALIIHAIVVRKGHGDLLMFAFLPLVIYVGINLPALVMFPYFDQIYPFEVDKESPGLLSRNGELVNVLSFSNTWWPQIPFSRFTDNLPYRYSGILIFALCALVFFIGYRKMKERGLLVLCILAILAAIFIAQGTKNPLMEWIIFQGIGSGLGRIMGLFREWGRITIMIPVFICLAFALSISAMKERRERAAAVCVLAVLILVNLISSPAWEYIMLFSGKYLPDYYSVLEAPSAATSKALLFVSNVSGHNFPVQTYPDYGPIRVLLDRQTPAPRILDALNVGNVYWDPNSSRRNLSWMDCEGRELVVCDNAGPRGMFSVYSGAIGTHNQTSYLDSILLGTGGTFVTSSQNGTEFRVRELNGSPAGPQKAVYIVEAERDFGKLAKPLALQENPFASGGKQVFFGQRKIITMNLSISRPGTYMLGLRGDGGFLVKVGENFRKVYANGSGFEYLGPMNLTAGQKELRLSADNGSTLDVVWIYESGQKLDEAFPLPKGEVHSQERRGPTLWKAEAHADSPLILAFAEPFSNLFEARVTDGSGRTEAVRPVEVLGGINGFPINQTGELQIEVRFTPQDAYAPAFISTWITLLCCIAYLGFAWWKR